MKQKIGTIGIDARLCWIGDPCYILHKEGDQKPKEIGKDWDDFCDKLGEDYPTKKQFNFDLGHPGLGIVISTGYGDGEYPVYADIVDGKIKSVTVKFF